MITLASRNRARTLSKKGYANLEQQDTEPRPECAYRILRSCSDCHARPLIEWQRYAPRSDGWTSMPVDEGLLVSTDQGRLASLARERPLQSLVRQNQTRNRQHT